MASWDAREDGGTITIDLRGPSSLEFFSGSLPDPEMRQNHPLIVRASLEDTAGEIAPVGFAYSTPSRPNEEGIERTAAGTVRFTGPRTPQTLRLVVAKDVAVVPVKFELTDVPFPQVETEPAPQ